MVAGSPGIDGTRRRAVQAHPCSARALEAQAGATRYRPGIVEGFLASIGLHLLPFLWHPR